MTIKPVTLAPRELFPILNKKNVLTSCSQSAIAEPVNQAITEYQCSLLKDGMDWESWMMRVNRAKASFAKLINADPDEIAILGSVSDCISSVLHALPLGGKDVCVTELDFPCIGQSILAQRNLQNFQINYLLNKNHSIGFEEFQQKVTNKTVLTCVPHVSYANGAKQEISQIADFVHDQGSLLFVDAYQSAGSMDIDVKASNVDILVTGMQKYMLGIPGISFMYIRKDLAEQLQPATTGWFGQANPFDFDLKHLNYAGGAGRFNTGTPPIANAYAADAALQLLLSIGTKEIEEYLTSLSSYTLLKAQQLDLPIASPAHAELKGAATAIYINHAAEVEKQLLKEGIMVSARKDVIRIAPHIYNSQEDIDEALYALKKLSLT